MPETRIVVVGCGSIGRRHARVLLRREELSVELCEKQPEQLERALQEVGDVPTHSSFQDMLNTQPEIVVIATPHALHAEQSIQSLQVGCHVLCEKPMSHSLVEAERMLHAVKQSTRIFSVGFTYHFNPVMRQLKEMIRVGEFGQILSVHFHVGTYVTLMNSVSRHQANVQGAIAMDYAHQPDLYYWLLEKMPTAVFSSGRQGGRLALQSNPNVMAVILEYDEPLIATMHFNYVQNPDRASLEIIGDKGWALFEAGSNSLRMGNHEKGRESVQQFEIERDALMADEHKAFLDAVAGRRPPESPAQEAILSMKVVEAILASWRTQARVEIPI